MCHKKFLYLLVLHFLPLIVTTIPGGGETGLLQTVVAVAVCSVPGIGTVADGDGRVSAVGGALKNPVGAASPIVPCWCYSQESNPCQHLFHLEVIFVVLLCLIPGWHTCVTCHAGFWSYDMQDRQLGIHFRGDPHHIHM